jgi:hypothetical protein
MIELSDEMLCAYLDGELDAATCKQIEQALQQDAGARVRLERMRHADSMLRSALPLKANATDDPLVTLIRSGAPVTRRKLSQVWPIALAASIAGIAIGVLVGLRVTGGFNPGAELAVMDAATGRTLQAALDATHSGGVMESNQARIEIVLSFRDQNGTPCRIADISGSVQAEVIACRAAEQWRLIAWDAATRNTDGFRTAGGSELMDTVMTQLGGRAALEPSEEQQLIDRQWR